MRLFKIFEMHTFDLSGNKFYPQLVEFVNKFSTSEQLLRSGGIPIELLDRLAHGFSENDITQLDPEQLNIRWFDDIENVKYGIKKSGLTPKEWASKVDLSEPILVDYRKDPSGENKFFVEDGHHRYTAAKILKKPLNVDISIKVNPIKEIAPDMDYDEFHRVVFDSIKDISD